MLNNRNYFNYFIYILILLFSHSSLLHAAASATDEVPSDYAIGPGDIISISVWKEEGMDKEVLVRPDGGITFPLAGDINAGGMTTSQLSQTLVSKLKRYIPNPNVTVSVLKAASNTIFVIGKVNRPGEYPATGYIDVLQALTKAGGLTPFAESDEIKILRTIDGKKMVKEFDYDEVISGERLDMNIILKPGDTVVVP